MTKTYTDASITTMSALQHIRTFTSRYLGEFDTPKGHTHQIKELIDNAIDEADAQSSKHHDIHITIIQLAKAIQVIVEDQGRGIPLKSLTAAYSEPRTSGKWSGAYAASAGVHGEGAKAVSAISKRFVGISKRQGEGIGLVEICNGEVTREQTYNRDSVDASGVLVFFESDPKFLASVGNYCTPDGGYPLLVELLEFLSVFVPNATFHLYQSTTPVDADLFTKSPLQIWNYLSTAYRNQKAYETVPASRRNYVMSKFRIKNPPTWEFSAHKELNPTAATIAENQIVATDFDLFVTAGLDYGLMSAVNLIPITDIGSFHFTVIVQVLKEHLARFITNKDVRNFFVSQYKLPLCGSVVVRVRMPKFGGQTKDYFRDKGFIAPYYQLVKQLFSGVSDTRWSTLYDLIAEHLDDEYSAFISRNMTSAQGLKNIGLRLNRHERYSDCDLRDPTRTELFITEGNSAGGTVAQVRDPTYQAVFTMRGKSLNALRCELSALGENDVFKDLIMVLGVRPGSTDLTGLNFSKIIILTDADSDGHHIAALLIGFLFKLCPALLESGKVYISNPPLYSLCVGKSKYYLKDDRALMDARIEQLYAKLIGVRMCNTKTGAFNELRDDDYRSYLYLVKHVGFIIENLAKITAVEPVYLEVLTQVVDYLTPDTMNTEKIRKTLNVDRVTYNVASNALVIVSGHIDLVIPLANLAPMLREELVPELQRMHWGEVMPWVTFLRAPQNPPQYMTIYKLYACLCQIDKMMPVDRYKGLGEMNPIEISRSCIEPTTRSYFVITSLGDVDRLYAALGTDSAQRKQLLM